MDFGEHVSGIQSTIVDPSLPHGKFLFNILHSRVVLLKVLQQLVQFVVNVGLVLHVDELVHLDEYINTMAMTRVVRIHESFSKYEWFEISLHRRFFLLCSAKFNILI